jgi:Ca-activated chloride channel family protein
MRYGIHPPRLFGTRAPIAALFLMSLAGYALSQDHPGSSENPRVSIEPRIEVRTSADGTSPDMRVTSNLVLIPVIVTDRLDHFVPGLAKEHFRVYEDKVEQTITHFASEDAPVSVGLVFDRSSSMVNKLNESRESVNQLLKAANPEDEFQLVTFSNRPEVVVKLTHDTAAVRNQLMQVQSHGRTALLDAIYVSMQEMRRAKNSRKALIIISDGGDNASRCTVSEIKNLAREADVQIFAIGIVDPIGMPIQPFEDWNGPALLREIATQTGGRLFEVNDVNRLPEIAFKIGVALRNTYILGYAPVNLRRDGKYHRVQLKLTKPKGTARLRASWRLGYYAPPQ